MIRFTATIGVGFFVSALYAALLFVLGKSKRASSKSWFYALAAAPTIIGALFLVAGLITDYSWLLFWVLVVVLVERAAWTLTLKEAAGRDKAAWFTIIYFVPLFGWLIYRVTRLR